MPCTVTGQLIILRSDGNREGVSALEIFAKPSRPDVSLLLNGQWYLFAKNTQIQDPKRQLSIPAWADNTGAFSFRLPFTDTEILQGDGLPIEWSIDTVIGPTYRGALPSTLPSTITLMKLIDDHGWRSVVGPIEEQPTLIESRTSDPPNPVIGQIWLRTDL